MSIWMDMTNSMHVWSGGVVGIVRAELEIAKNMYKQSKDIRFVKFTGQVFEEIPAEELSWLWEAESVGDAYLKAMHRNQLSGLVDDKKNNGEYLSKEQLIAKHPHLQNAFNYSSSRLYRLEWGLLLYANSMSDGIGNCLKKIISFVFYLPKKAANARGNARSRRLARKALEENRKNASQQNKVRFKHPFKEGDTVFSCGWMFSGKEEAFEKVKSEIDIYLSYLVYDIILIRENTAQFYDTQVGFNSFKKYVHWVSMHCDAVLYGGKTAMEDTREYQKKNNLPSPPGYPVYFGSDIVKSKKTDEEKWKRFRKSIGLDRDYLMVVGSIDERKNYSTLYRAFTILADRKYKNMPQLVIVGKGNACIELKNTILRDPRTKDTILFSAPADEELDWLYQNAKFVLLASAWEGWSLTLPEALQYGKMVICSDVTPLREIGGSLVDYADTYDPFEWADKITYYMDNGRELKAREEKIRSNFSVITWQDCGKQVYDILSSFASDTHSDIPTLYFDISLTRITALMNGNITGIMRAELMLIKNLYSKYPKVKFFAIDGIRGYIPIDVSCLECIITGNSLDEDFEVCKEKLRINDVPVNDPSEKLSEFEQKLNSRAEAYWFLTSIMSEKKMNRMISYGKEKKQKMIEEASEKAVSSADTEAESSGIFNMPVGEGDVIFTAGTGFDDKTYAKLLREKQQKKFRYCGIIYDYTPVLLPQTHREATVEFYGPFLENYSKICDMILYGGETAQKDGIRYQKENGQRIPESYAIKFGSDISKKEPDDDIDQKKVLKDLGIKKGYIMAVGTMEQRKNYETLYRAYLRMLENYGYDDIPQMVFAGHKGWNANEFITTMSRDDRVKGKILMLTPTDEQLDILYRNCEFTVLASLYEGWSLTLPESMHYKKFCICCDTPALKETAGELSEYIHAWDEKKWSERIHFYHTHPDEIEKREKMIKENWHSISWNECAEDVMGHLKELLEKK